MLTEFVRALGLGVYAVRVDGLAWKVIGVSTSCFRPHASPF